ncbi:MAG TPA: DinB family protein [Anaerolineales bacterium]|nr:DinB family protein [Anaerolineales bacterium]
MNFDTLYLELVDSTSMIQALLSGISDEEARIRPAPGSWSMLEVVCHLYDEEREDFREHLDFILHRQNEEWHRIDPEGWVVERRYSERSLRDMKDRFFGERSNSLDWLKGLGDSNWEASYTTPYRTISAGGMFACWVAHDNLHIRQLVELRRAHIERISQPLDLGYAGDW